MMWEFRFNKKEKVGVTREVRSKYVGFESLPPNEKKVGKVKRKKEKKKENVYINKRL